MRLLWPLTVGSLFLAGCGGGSSSALPAGSHETASGPFVAKSLTPGRLLTMAGTNTVVVGLFGASYDTVRLQQPPIGGLLPSGANDSTVIMMQKSGRPAFYDYGRGELTTLSLQSPIFGNASKPDMGPLYDRIVWTPFLTGNQEVYQSFPDGTGNFLLNATQNVRMARYSPDGARIALAITGNNLAIMNSSGSGLTTLITEASSINTVCWSPDGSKILYGSGNSVKSIPYGGGAPTTLVSSQGQNFYTIAFRSPTNWVAISNGDFAYYGTMTAWTAGFAVAGPIYGVSYSPDYRWMAVESPEGVRIRAADDWAVGGSLVGSGHNSPRWAPYMEKRTMVGPSGGYGTNCAGFFYSMSRKQLGAFVTVESPTPASVTFEKGDNSNPGQDSIFSTVLAPGGLSAVKFQNRLYGTRYTAVTSSPPSVGAVVVFDAFDGAVNFILPFNGTAKPSTEGSGDSDKVLRGTFTAIYDKEGKNLAPTGASAISVSRDGKLARIIKTP